MGREYTSIVSPRLSTFLRLQSISGEWMPVSIYTCSHEENVDHPHELRPRSDPLVVFTPPLKRYQHKGAPTICPSTASQGVQTLCIYAMIRGCSLWGVGASTMTLQHHSDSVIAPIFQNPPPLIQVGVEKCKGAPICPSTASQGAQTLFIHPLWMWDAVNGGL
jgi:hypothetical protein